MTIRTEKTYRELELRCRSLRADLYQMCGGMAVRSMEVLCRKLHQVEIKLHSFKKHGNKQEGC